MLSQSLIGAEKINLKLNFLIKYKAKIGPTIPAKHPRSKWITKASIPNSLESITLVPLPIKMCIKKITIEEDPT